MTFISWSSTVADNWYVGDLSFLKALQAAGTLKTIGAGLAVFGVGAGVAKFATPGFADDIKGQNTQLYPIVVIDGVYYSTNNVTVDGNYCKPILMNIPSIKQSIDIESKKFKISNVNLNFNNFSFGGKRFSEQLSDTSLINKEVIIYFKSPSTNTIDDFYLAYKGVVRRISHDDTLVKIQVEDLTEKDES